MNLAERLKEKSRVLVDNSDYYDAVLLSDALEICKDAYSKDEVIELLKKQRENCAKAVDNLESNEGQFANYCLSAPSPKLKGE